MNCKKCGLCCKWLLVATLPKGGELDWDYIKARDLIAVDRGNFISLYINAPCKYLTDNNLCSIQDSKPESCLDFPSNKDEALPGCAWWDEEEDGEKKT